MIYELVDFLFKKSHETRNTKPNSEKNYASESKMRVTKSPTFNFYFQFYSDLQ